jgi:very-short-patch-repair endonuclease
MLDGWIVMRFTHNQVVSHAGRVAAQITAAYARRLN